MTPTAGRYSELPEPAAVRPLEGWVWLYGLIGASAAPLLLCLFACLLPAGWFSSKIALAPVIGFLVGAAGGIAGWLMTRLTRRLTDQLTPQGDR
jgi:hypothetical protein